MGGGLGYIHEESWIQNTLRLADWLNGWLAEDLFRFFLKYYAVENT